MLLHWSPCLQSSVEGRDLDLGGARVYTSSALRRGHGSRAGRRSGAAPLWASWLLWSFVHTCDKEWEDKRMFNMKTDHNVHSDAGWKGENVSSICCCLSLYEMKQQHVWWVWTTSDVHLSLDILGRSTMNSTDNNNAIMIQMCSCLRFIFQL